MAFQYEKFPIFCYWCGLFNHDEKDCTLWTSSGGTLNTADQQYGAWFRAPVNILQQPQVSNSNTRPNPNPPRAPPCTPPPMPPLHAGEKATATPTSNPTSQPNLLDTSPPTNPTIVTPHTPDKFGSPDRCQSFQHAYHGY